MALQVTQENRVPFSCSGWGRTHGESGRQPCWQASQMLGGMIRVAGRDGEGGGEFRG